MGSQSLIMVQVTCTAFGPGQYQTNYFFCLKRWWQHILTHYQEGGLLIYCTDNYSFMYAA
jgi:hypothetical protein